MAKSLENEDITVIHSSGLVDSHDHKHGFADDNDQFPFPDSGRRDGGVDDND